MVGERYGFAYCTAEAEEIFAAAGINTIFVATRHDSHAGYVVRALESGRHVFVEKPLCLTAAASRWPFTAKVFFQIILLDMDLKTAEKPWTSRCADRRLPSTGVRRQTVRRWRGHRCSRRNPDSLASGIQF
jgi:hypothetical protein